MPKLKGKSIGIDDLSEYLSGHSDFGFELSVLKMLREHDIDCEHGGHYEDPVSGKSREFDIRAAKTFGHYSLRMAVECKNIRPNFPVLISCVPRHKQESYHQISAAQEPDRDNFSAAPNISPRASAYSMNGKRSLYLEGEPVGKSTVQVGRAMDGNITANDSELFEKWGQCLASSKDLVERMYWDGEDDKEADDFYISSVIPFVVLPDDTLWTVNYNEDGTQLADPELTKRCPCFVDKHYKMGTQRTSEYFSISHVEIVTISGLRNFVETYLVSEATLENICSKNGLFELF